MALGGGNFTTMDKALPGVYVNAQSTGLASADNSNRGIVALPMVMKWGAEDKIVTITKDELASDGFASYKYFGYAYSADEMKPIRDIFQGATKLLLYRADDNAAKATFTVAADSATTTADTDGTTTDSTKENEGSTKATKTLGTVKYAGSRGNDISVIVDNSAHEAITYFGTTKVDTYAYDGNLSKLENDYVSLDLSTVTPETLVTYQASGGTDGSVTTESLTAFTELLESYAYNILCCPFTSADTQQTLIKYTIRARENLGLNSQIVVIGSGGSVTHGEAVIELVSEQANALYWVAGQLAGATVGTSLSGTEYGGEGEITGNYSNSKLEQFVKAGQFVIHNVNGTLRVLKDINTLTEYTETKSKLFASNDTIRTIDQISNDVGVVFAKYVYGKVRNNDTGRELLRNDISDVLDEIAETGAIEKVDFGSIAVSYVDKNAVSVTVPIVLVGAIEQIYITIAVS